MDLSDLKELSAVPSKLPERLDWEFTLSDTSNYPLMQGEARIVLKIAGDEVVDAYRHIHVPEEWARNERKERNTNTILNILCIILMSALLLSVSAGAIVSWSRKKFSTRIFLIFFILLVVVSVISLINDWPGTIAGFSTAKPLANQIYMAIALSLLGSLFLSGGLALVAGFVQIWRRQEIRIHRPEAVLLGSSLGILIVGIGSLINQLTPSLKPLWADYHAVQAYLPFLSAGIGPLVRFILITVTMLIIFIAVDRSTNSWTRRKWLFVTLLLLIGLTTAGVDGIDQVTSWFFQGLLMGIVYLMSYLLIFRFNMSLIPLTSGMITIMVELRQGMFDAYPGSIPGATLAIILIASLSYYWFLQLSEVDPVRIE
jgi:hypothetical protein